LADFRRLSGGASKESILVTLRDGAGEGGYVLRRAVAGHDDGFGLGPGIEAALLQAAGTAGAAVPGVAFVLDDQDDLGPGFVMHKVEGETLAPRIQRDDAFARARAALPEQLGRALARIHRARIDHVAGLPEQPIEAQIAHYRGVLDQIGVAAPALELGLAWAAAHRPAAPRTTLVHGDFRLGNLMVDHQGLAAVLDWELSHRGDPMEDLGWLCIRSWRFGRPDLPVAGIGGREALFAAYEAEAGIAVDRAAVHFWEVFGNVKWGAICLIQASRHVGGQTRSVELAAIGRRMQEPAFDLLGLLRP
jgi:aminoglycoside phosphotransferase (APT) family kinase protein